MSRFTRSRTIPDWSLHEMLTLVLEIDAAADEHGSTLSSHQKWHIVADHLIALNVHRNSSQCRRKWDSLLSEHRAIKEWESRSRSETASTSRSSGADSYWCLEAEKRKDLKLPVEFDRELFGLMEGFINKEVTKAKDHMVVAERDSSSSPSSSSSSSSSDGKGGEKRKRKRKRKRKEEEIMERLQERSGELQENVEQIEAILKKKTNALNTEEFTRQQADELIKVFGRVVATLDRLK